MLGNPGRASDILQGSGTTRHFFSSAITMSCANILCLTRDKKQRFTLAFVIVC
ncbi:TPA: hypothetical protein MFN52_002357 [Klebsiella quasipneumoniae subsp. similipneumoniae]|nr:hypothetical protein [Klebsiella quasipneumoniae subsp. similipneumoniae]